MTRIIDIVDNRATDGFIAEHGLSLLIERGDERILFDTGAGTALHPNATKLGINLENVTRIILSHSHNDHTGGLGTLTPKSPIYIGKGFDVPCFSRHADGTIHSLEVPPQAHTVIATSDIRIISEFTMISDGIYLSGPIDRVTGEDNGKSFFCDKSCTKRNYVPEEQSLLTADGILVTGCCHAGIANTVKTFNRLAPHIPIRIIIGGLHLCHATNTEITYTRDFLSRLNLDKLILLHCTGETASSIFSSTLPYPVICGSAGTIL